MNMGTDKKNTISNTLEEAREALNNARSVVFVIIDKLNDPNSFGSKPAELPLQTSQTSQATSVESLARRLCNDLRELVPILESISSSIA